MTQNLCGEYINIKKKNGLEKLKIFEGLDITDLTAKDYIGRIAISLVKQAIHQDRGGCRFKDDAELLLGNLFQLPIF